MEASHRLPRWSVGPTYGILSGIFVAVFIYLAWQQETLFNLNALLPNIHLRGYFFTVGGITAILGLSLWIPAAFRIDSYLEKDILADRGLYGIVRNPIYSGILFFVTGICIAAHTALLLIPPVLSYVLLRLMLIREEHILTEAFGKDYLTYKSRVPAVIPAPAGIKSAFFYPEETSKRDIVCHDDAYEEPARNPGIDISPDIDINSGRHLSLYTVRDGDVNAFIVSDGITFLAIDAGYSSDRIARELALLGVDPGKVEAVFLTHTDRDHRGGLPLFSQADLYIGRDEAQMIEGRRYRLPCYKNSPVKRTFTPLDNGAIIRAGSIIVEAISTAGHTPGHMAYLVNRRLLFTGDAVIRQNGAVRSFYRLLNMNQRQAEQSTVILQELMREPVQQEPVRLRTLYLCTAHTGAEESPL
jgi:hydroxyacylglutathione hydrolase